jgi:hypothetical protein
VPIAIEAVLDLAVEDTERFVPLALFERFADADDRRQPGTNRRDRLAVDHRIGLAEQPPPLGVADDHELGARILDHRCRHFASKRAVALPVDVLCRDGDVRVPQRFGGRMDGCERRGDDNLDAVHVLEDAAQLFGEDGRLVDRLEHLPVAGNERDAHVFGRPEGLHYLSGRA